MIRIYLKENELPEQWHDHKKGWIQVNSKLGLKVTYYEKERPKRGRRKLGYLSTAVHPSNFWMTHRDTLILLGAESNIAKIQSLDILLGKENLTLGLFRFEGSQSECSVTIRSAGEDQVKISVEVIESSSQAAIGSFCSTWAKLTAGAHPLDHWAGWKKI